MSKSVYSRKGRTMASIFFKGSTLQYKNNFTILLYFTHGTIYTFRTHPQSLNVLENIRSKLNFEFKTLLTLTVMERTVVFIFHISILEWRNFFYENYSIAA